MLILHCLRMMLFQIAFSTHSITYSYACRNIVNTMKMSEHTSLEKYTSHTLFENGNERVMKGYVWEVSWRLNKDWSILTPSSSGHSSISFSFCWAAQLEAWGPSLCWDLVLTPRTATTDFKLWSPTNWLPVAPGLYHCLMPTCFLWHHNSHSIQPVDSQGYPQISLTGCTCYLHRCISHLTAWPGQRLICYNSSINFLSGTVSFWPNMK